MQQITRSEKDWLIANNFLKLENGKYPDLSITSKRKRGKGKKYFVVDYLAEKVKTEMYKK